MGLEPAALCMLCRCSLPTELPKQFSWAGQTFKGYIRKSKGIFPQITPSQCLCYSLCYVLSCRCCVYRHVQQTNTPPSYTIPYVKKPVVGHTWYVDVYTHTTMQPPPNTFTLHSLSKLLKYFSWGRPNLYVRQGQCQDSSISVLMLVLMFSAIMYVYMYMFMYIYSKQTLPATQHSISGQKPTVGHIWYVHTPHNATSIQHLHNSLTVQATPPMEGTQTQTPYYSIRHVWVHVYIHVHVGMYVHVHVHVGELWLL